jgi:two-component system OmpR family response regulator
MLVSRLREKLGDDPKQPRFIRTVRNGGYQFVGAVRK